jgi:hypothetical protein
MEFKEDTVIALRVWQDELMGVSFIDVLGKEELYSIKLPSTIDKYKLGHLINPTFLLDIELVKTRKNWVLKQVSIHEQLAKPTTYDEHMILSEMIKTLARLSYSDQTTSIQGLVIQFFKGALTGMQLSRFEAAVLDHEGFLHDSEHTTISKRISTTKSINNLE